MKLTVYGNGLECREEMRCVADCYTEQDAQTIAHRVNVHDELVAALEGAQNALRKALPHMPPDSDSHYVGEWLDEVNAALERVKQ